MKGTIVKCLQEVVEGKGGTGAWKDTLVKAGKPAVTMYLTTAVVPDDEVVALITAAAEVLGLPAQGVMDAFGEHWSCVYAPKLYGTYYAQAKDAKSFLLNMNNVHVAITKSAGASPPQFTFQERGDRELVMTYSSPRGLAALMPGLIRGVGKYYDQNVQVRASGNTMTITFA